MIFIWPVFGGCQVFANWSFQVPGQHQQFGIHLAVLSGTMVNWCIWIDLIKLVEAMSIKEDGFFKALFSVLDTALETQSFQVAILHFCIFSFLLETSGRINGFIFDVFASGGRVNQSINAEDLGWFCRHRVHCFHARVQRRFLFPLVARQQFSQNYSWGNAETTVIHRLESNPAIHLLY